MGRKLAIEVVLDEGGGITEVNLTENGELVKQLGLEELEFSAFDLLADLIDPESDDVVSLGDDLPDNGLVTDVFEPFGKPSLVGLGWEDEDDDG